MSKRFLLVLAISFFLGGCGGGGDDNASNEAASTPAQPLTVPLSTAMAGLAANGLTANFSISGTVESPACRMLKGKAQQGVGRIVLRAELPDRIGI
ncbi:hypothetical protein [Cupriavidus sp. amp6]|uniref:hypothetical protein n=1 Tax=Cupriavidus sp. amp6 TaxID=388051 RepID=UPI0012EBB4B9|nr:hypothetical protein [Cupriavidus sp. amp6]